MIDSGIDLPVGFRAIPAPALFDGEVSLVAVGFGYETAPRADIDLPGELARAVPKRRIEFTAGRVAARMAIHALAPELAETPVGVGPGRQPLWPAGLCGSITHTHGYAAAAVSRLGRLRGVGIDAELPLSEAAAPHVARTVLTAGEAERFFARESELEALTVLFSAKESLFKCLFPTVGRYFDFREAELVEMVRRTATTGTVRLRLLCALSPELPSGWLAEGRFSIDRFSIDGGPTGLIQTAVVWPSAAPGRAAKELA